MRDSAPGDVQVWAINVVGLPVPAGELWAVLSAAEQQRAERFRHAADRRRSVVARGVLRMLLAEALNCVPSELEFAETEHGKPVLHGGRWRAPEFNVSHSGDWVLIALSGAGPVGVDVEEIRTVRELEAIATRYFAPAEALAIRSAPASRRLAAFFTCWTRKEAFVKALGTGMQTPLERFQVTAAEQAAALVSIEDSFEAAAEWTLLDVPPDDAYAAAVAVQAPGVRATLRLWPGTESAAEFSLRDSAQSIRTDMAS
ncbi:N/A [soil metagenome]